jgi:hypothetical protein
MKRILTLIICILFFIGAATFAVLGFANDTSVRLQGYKMYGEKNILISKTDGRSTKPMTLQEAETVYNAYLPFTFEPIYTNGVNSITVTCGGILRNSTTSWSQQFVSFSGCMAIDADIMTRYDFELAEGRLPQRDDELCITVRELELYKLGGYVDKNGHTVSIGGPDDVLGRLMVIEGKSFSIVGIIDTKLNKSFRLTEKIDRSQAESIICSDTDTVFSDMIERSPHNALFLHRDGIADVFEVPAMRVTLSYIITLGEISVIPISEALIRQPPIIWAEGVSEMGSGIVLSKNRFRDIVQFHRQTEEIAVGEITEGDLLAALNEGLTCQIGSLTLAVMGFWDNDNVITRYDAILSEVYFSVIQGTTLPDTRIMSLITRLDDKNETNRILFETSVRLEGDCRAEVLPTVGDWYPLSRKTVWMISFAICSLTATLFLVVFLRKKV